jgi:2-oxoglutarate ferredoxin oxidoreductase subunit alpha
VPLHADAILGVVNKAKKVLIVENNYSGQFARYLRSETSIVADGHIRKYDGEPFMPHHIVEGVKANLAQQNLVERTAAKAYVPRHEIMV